MPSPILDVRNLTIDYPISIGTVRAVDDVSFDLYRGETLGLVGESGCGKSTLGLSILKLQRPPGRISGGRIMYFGNDPSFSGQDIAALSEHRVRSLRGRRVAMVFQNPLTSLNPLYRIDRHFLETIRHHESGVGRRDALARAESILERLGIDAKRLYEYPHQLSGGMRQRIMIGLGLIMNPEIVIADEPTTSLDVIVEAGFVDLLNLLRREFHLAIVLITHNLGLVAQIADRIAVMYAGKIVELGESAQVFHRPLHPYTQGLIRCVPNIKLEQTHLATMPGSPPDLVMPPPGCRFASRCPHASGICKSRAPELKAYNDRGTAACWLYEPELNREGGR